MVSDPLVLGFDTSAAHCAAALLRGDVLLGSFAKDMTRGQAEELMPLIEELLAEHAVGWKDLDALGVGVGPGNFTGIRISVSAARGLALSLNIPCLGVSTFEASLLNAAPGTVAAVPAPRDQQYVLEPGAEPRLVSLPYEGESEVVNPPVAKVLAENIARCALARMGTDIARPAPLYIRAADAAPSRDLPPKIL
ncbi:MAG: tRNA (adenosine(37)-N6)-threonylcarbamoyltransferase complex dimerization subunit type 1 TsaB [Cognatishimia sp.]|uniref:tRNA (adenosine(37)-N6)-threonylcarbamoyltransferase complex dimerization subunit type 1 TsaB n=1 Tax=Cognatishimia sp. TaxID=2211648 RepID=UPI003B8DBB00